MKKKSVWLVVSCLVLVALLLGSCAPAVTKEEGVAPAPEEGEQASPAGSTIHVEQEPLVKSITTIVGERGGRVDWGHNNMIVHSRYGEDGYYDLWIMKPDGSAARCLTCDNPGVPQLHNGQPAWHPSGEYIVFQSQDPSLPHTQQEDSLQTQPGFGKHNNLWITDAEGDCFYRLTNIEQNMAILHAHFSHDGSRLTWAEKVGYGASDWAIMVADFVKTPEPHLTNITPYQPLGRVWYETHAFSPDDAKILFTAGTGAQAWSGFDIWEMEIATQELKQLTSNPNVWDEHAHYSPDGTKIVWASSQGYPYDTEAKAFWKVARSLKLDYWLMDADGSNKQRLTYFNEPGHEEYIGYPVIVADSSWSPDRKELVATILFGRGREDARIVVIELNDNTSGSVKDSKNTKYLHPCQLHLTSQCLYSPCLFRRNSSPGMTSPKI